MSNVSDVRNLPDPHPELPIYARYQDQNGGITVYQNPDGTFRLADEAGEVFEDDLDEQRMLILFQEAILN